MFCAILSSNSYCKVTSPSKQFLLNKMVLLEQIVKNNKKCVALIDSLQTQLAIVQKEVCDKRKIQLKSENTQLQEQVELAKAKLIEWELKNDKKLYAIPTRNTTVLSKFHYSIGKDGIGSENVQEDKRGELEKCVLKAKVKEKNENNKCSNKEKKMEKEKPIKSAKTNDTDNNAKESLLPLDIRRLDLRVGKILEVKHHPDADSLYLEKIDCGESEARTVVSGLVKFIPIEEMENRLVVVLCNLKPAKMRGIVSEAMVMCASTPEKVEILSPPITAEPGDLILCDGYPRQPDAVLNPKKKIFETCAPDLKTNDDMVACYKEAALHIPNKGLITAQTLKNVPIK